MTSCLVDIRRIHWDLVIGVHHVQFGENGNTLQRIRKVIDVGDGVASRDSIPVQCTIVPTWTPIVTDFFGTICSGVDHAPDEGHTIPSCIIMPGDVPVQNIWDLQRQAGPLFQYGG